VVVLHPHPAPRLPATCCAACSHAAATECVVWWRWCAGANSRRCNE
jgi:hypothetical protein